MCEQLLNCPTDAAILAHVGLAQIILQELVGREPTARPERQLVDALTRDYARLLERYVLRRPQDWSGWYTMGLGAEPEAAPLAASRAARKAV